MDYNALMNSLQRGVVAPVYLLYGEEDYLKHQAIAKLKEVLLPQGMEDFNLDLLDGKQVTVANVVDTASTLPFMADKRLVIVEEASIFQARRKKKEQEEEEESSAGDDILQQYLNNPATSTCLIFLAAEGVDKRKKIYKLVEKVGQVVEFTPLKSGPLVQWVEDRAAASRVKVNREAVGNLVALVGSNLYQMANELDKLATYVGDGGEITSQVVEELVSKTSESSVFQLVDAVAEKRFQEALQILKEMLLYGEVPVKILILLARQVRLMLLAKNLIRQGYSEKQVAGDLRVHPFVAQKCIKQGRNFSEEELLNSLTTLTRMDIDIKRGQQDPVLGLELFIMGLGK
ncbi:MAG: DNA polymerase III subunit delta [Thermincolia bacterium]